MLPGAGTKAQVMYYHSLALAEPERARLNRLYEALARLLEMGKTLPLASYGEWKQTLSEVLVSQQGLEHFWQDVADQPLQHWHLHLVYTDKELLNLPWQQLAIDDQRFPFTRVSKGAPPAGGRSGLADSEAVLPEYKPQAGPLKILVMISSPEDLAVGHRLSYEEEEEAILKALAPLWETNQVQVDFTEEGNLRALQQELDLQHYHILYYSGHGRYKQDTGYLLLEDEETLRSREVPAADLARTLMEKPEHMPALVILAGCQTARGEARPGFRGITDELLHCGVPAVIAMAFNVLDSYATVFAAALCQQLSRREPLLRAYGKALREMRAAEQVWLDGFDVTQAPSQWLIPQLYYSRLVDHVVDWGAQEKPLKTNTSRFIEGGHFLFFNPHKNYRFIGRRREFARIFGRLQAGEAVLLRGQGGVGKTAMAEQLVRRMLTHDPAHAYFAFNETGIGIQPMMTMLQDWLEKEHRLFTIRQEVEKRQKGTGKLDFLLEKVAERCKPLWVFDNMETCQEGTGGPLKQEYREWMDYVKSRLTGQFPVIFTGRYPVDELAGTGDYSLNQAPFMDFYRKCLQLELRKIADAREADGLTFTGIAHLLYTTLGGSYRAIEFFDEVYREQPAAVVALLRQLADQLMRVDRPEERRLTRELAAGVQEKMVSYAKKLVFAELLRLLMAEELGIFRLLACFRLPVLPLALEMQLEDGAAIGPALQRLVDLTLIEEQQKDKEADSLCYYYVTPLVRDWLAEQELPDITFSDARAGAFFEYAYVNFNHGGIEELIEAFSHYRVAGNVEKLNSIGLSLTKIYYDNAMYWHVAYYARAVEDVSGEETHPEIFNRLALVLTVWGSFNVALIYLNESLKRRRSSGDRAGEVSNLNNIGQLYRDRGEYGQALSYLQQALDLAVSLSDPEREAKALNDMGEVYFAGGDHDKALECLERSLQIREPIGNQRDLAETFADMGSVYFKRGDLPGSLDYFGRALDIFRSSGMRLFEGKTLGDIGVVYYDMRDFQKAADLFEQAETVSAEYQDTRAQERNCYNLAQAYIALRDNEKALEYLERSLSIMRTFDHRPDEAVRLAQAGLFYNAMGNEDKALEYLEKSIALKPALEDAALELERRGEISLIYLGREEYDKALVHAQEALTIQRTINDRKELADVLHATASIAWMLKAFEQSVEYDIEAYEICAEDGYEEGLYDVGRELGFNLCMLSDPEYRELGLPVLYRSYEIGLRLSLEGVEEVARRIQVVEEERELRGGGSSDHDLSLPAN